MVETLERIADLTEATRSMVAGAMAVATGRLNLGDPRQTRERIILGDQLAIEYFRHELAHQVAMLLIRSDEHVKSVFVEQELPEAEELAASAPSMADPIYLVVFSGRETVALRSLVDAVDNAIVRELAGNGIGVSPGLIVVDVINSRRAQRICAPANGFRPPPMLLVSRGE